MIHILPSTNLSDLAVALYPKNADIFTKLEISSCTKSLYKTTSIGPLYSLSQYSWNRFQFTI